MTKEEWLAYIQKSTEAKLAYVIAGDRYRVKMEKTLQCRIFMLLYRIKNTLRNN